MGQTLIKNGRVVTPETVVDADVLINGEIIQEIGTHLDTGDAKVIDAGGKIVLPGGIDVHTHFCLDVGIAVAQDDFYTGTVAAAMGGTTCIVDHPGFGPDGCSLFHQIEHYHGLAKGNAVIDYSFHGVLQHLDDQVMADIPRLADQGVTSMKAYMTYDKRFTPEMLKKLFAVTGEAGVLIAVHAEDDATVHALRQKHIENGETQPIFHALSRPNAAEAKAVHQVIDIACNTNNAPLYIVHLSTRQGLGHVNAARLSGQVVMAETCPQYLFLTDTAYHEPDHGGLKYVMSPPLRSVEDQDALWDGCLDESISTIGTDHCPFDFKLKKKLAAGGFSKCPGGAPGVETRMPLIFSRGVQEKGMSLNLFSRLVSENPARIMGLYPKKGILAPGSDADIVIMDPAKTVFITHDLLHENVDYTPYEGITVKGWPVMTMARGRVIAENGTFCGEKGYGQFIKRSRIGTDTIN